MSIATPSSTRGPTSSPRSPDMIRTKKTLHLRPHRSIIEEGALAPLHHRFRIKIVAAGELLDRSLRSLYSSSDGVRGLGAAVKNLSHRASRNVASAWLIPRHSGTAHLAQPQFHRRYCSSR